MSSLAEHISQLREFWGQRKTSLYAAMCQTMIEAHLSELESLIAADSPKQPTSQSDEALVEGLRAYFRKPEYTLPPYVESLFDRVEAVLSREAAARAGVLHIGTMKVWRGQTPGTIFIQQDDGEGGEFPEADLEAIWQSYYAENF